jgi:HD-GYP domain-containing protein (c-di-GMP phosphodiesterase class II)
MQRGWTARASEDQFDFTIDDASVARNARLLFVEYLRAWSGPSSDIYAAEVIFGELTSNVVQHAPGPLTARVYWLNGSAVLEVWDNGPGYAPHVSFPDSDSESHRGLILVAALGGHLQVDRREGRTVTSVVLPVVSAHLPAQPVSMNAFRSAAPPGSGVTSPDEIVDALLAVASTYDQELAIHMNSVADLAVRTAVGMGMDQSAVTRCRLASRVHDIGLITVDKHIVDWPCELDEWERELIKLHSQRGEAIVKGIPALSHLARVIRTHHEHVDGTGYPDGLVGEDIPIESRLISVVDAFHAMTIPRTYRAIMSAAAAYRELERHSGSQFDPEVVSAFGSILGYGSGRIWDIAADSSFD